MTRTALVYAYHEYERPRANACVHASLCLSRKCKLGFHFQAKKYKSHLEQNEQLNRKVMFVGAFI